MQLMGGSTLFLNKEHGSSRGARQTFTSVDDMRWQIQAMKDIQGCIGGSLTHIDISGINFEKSEGILQVSKQWQLEGAVAMACRVEKATCT